MSGFLRNPVVLFVVTLVMVSSSSVATATIVDLNLSSLTGKYQLGESPTYNPAYVHSQTTTLGASYTDITAFSRTLTGSFILPKYLDAQGNVVDGYIEARQFVRDLSASNPNFNYLFNDNLQSNSYHYVNTFGTVTDFKVTEDQKTGIYSFAYSQTMSDPTNLNWIAGITTGNVFSSMWFNNYGLNGYTLFASGSAEINDAEVHFDNAGTPTPVPSSLFLLAAGGVPIILYRRQYMKAGR